MAHKTKWWMLAALLLVCAPVTAQPAADLDGDWQGALATPSGITLHLALHVETKGAATSAILTSLDQGNVQIPVAAVTRTGDDVTLDVPMVNGGFKGRLAGDTLAGTWHQGADMPLTFTRLAAK